MKQKSYSGALSAILSAVLPLLLSGCSSALMDPKGQVGEEQRVLIITAFVLMLIVVIPVIVMTILFAYRYREGNKDAAYTPDWAHSTAIEVVVWFIPCVIIVVLAVLTWITSHSLNPMKPIAAADGQEPIEIQAVSLDWKWLFIYPAQRVATVNEVAFPADRPIHFRISSGSVMNSFWIPELGSQIYAMAGMDSSLHLMSDKAFRDWVKKVGESGQSLSFNKGYQALAEPSTDVPVQYYSDVSPDLYKNILNSFRKGMEAGGEHGESGENGKAKHGEPMNAEAAE